MTNLINKLLAKFNLKLVYLKQKPDVSLVEASVKFLNENPKFVSDQVKPNDFYWGDINYVQKIVDGEFPQVSGKTYYKSILTASSTHRAHRFPSHVWELLWDRKAVGPGMLAHMIRRNFIIVHTRHQNLINRSNHHGSYRSFCI